MKQLAKSPAAWRVSCAAFLSLAIAACSESHVGAGATVAAQPAAATGAIRCTVRLDGTAPALPLVAPDKNVEHCGAELADPVLLVDDGGVREAVVALVRPSWDGVASPAGELELRSRGCLMEPRVQTAGAGVRLVIGNGDGITHNPHAWLDDRVTVFNITLLDDAAQARRTLREPGIYRVDCDTHSWMRAFVHVFDHPFHAVTAAQGAATLRDVPAGRHELRVWHEVLGERTVEVEVAAGECRDVEVAFESIDRRPARLTPPGMQPWIPRLDAGSAAATVR